MQAGQVYDPRALNHGAPPPWLLALPPNVLCQGAKLAFIVLMNAPAGAWPTEAEVGAAIGVSRRQAGTYLNQLETAGLIRHRRTGLREANSYQFTWPPDALSGNLGFIPDGKSTAHQIPKPDGNSLAASDGKSAAQPEIASPPPHPIRLTPEAKASGKEQPPSGVGADAPSLDFELTSGHTLTETEQSPATRTVRASARDYNTAQAFNIAADKCAAYYQAQYVLAFPGRRKPGVAGRQKNGVKETLKLIRNADGGDWLQAETECKRLIDLFLRQRTSFLETRAHDITHLPGEFEPLRNGATNAHGTNGRGNPPANGRYPATNGYRNGSAGRGGPVPELSEAHRRQSAALLDDFDACVQRAPVDAG